MLIVERKPKPENLLIDVMALLRATDEGPGPPVAEVVLDGASRADHVSQASFASACCRVHVRNFNFRLAAADRFHDPDELTKPVQSRGREMFLEEGDEVAAHRETLLAAVEHARQAGMLEHHVEELRHIVLGNFFHNFWQALTGEPPTG